jgi:hypothetical protein
LPRVALNPTPYAIGLMPGLQTIGSLSGTGGIIRATNNGQGAALVGLANSATGTTYGVLGNAFSPNGYAVWGYANGGAIGVTGVSAANGNGVQGSSVTGSGVWGASTSSYGAVGDSIGGAGVRGHSTNGAGVEAESDTLDGVRGIAHAATRADC